MWPLSVRGHELNESAEEALGREITEETGWRLRRIVNLVADWEWEHDGQPRRELDFLVEVDGNLSAPQLEATKHDAYAWVGLEELHHLRDISAECGRTLIEIVAKSFDEH